jgi:hypothetical protein
VKLDFSATNFKAKVTGWRLSIENKADTLFPTVCDTARGIAGIAAAAVDSTQLEHQDPQILARANLVSEDEDEHEDNTQAIDEDHGDGFDEHDHDNGVDNGNNSRVVEDHNVGGDDSDGHDHDNEGDNRSSEEDEDNSKASLGGADGSDDDDVYNNGNNDGAEENYAEGSDLTEIGSSSDVGKIA